MSEVVIDKHRNIRELETDRDRWRHAAWECAEQSGMDLDGAGPQHISPEFAVQAVVDLREAYDEACEELDVMEKALAFYADATRYEYPRLALLKEDRGRRARVAIRPQNEHLTGEEP